MTDRTYSEKEVAALLERTVALQTAMAHRKDARTGLTLAELETVAAEAGLDPALLRQAAEEMDEVPPLLRHSAGTSATHVFAERWVPGALTPDAWEDVVIELRHRFDTDLGTMMGMPHYGESATEQLGRTVSWKHTSLSGIETRVLARPRGDGVHLRLSQRVGWGSAKAEGLTYGTTLAGIAVLLAAAAVSSAWVGVVIFLLALVVAVPAIFMADKAWRQKKHRALETLADEVGMLLTTPEATAPEARIPQPESLPTPAPPLLDADAAPATERSAARARGRTT